MVNNQTKFVITATTLVMAIAVASLATIATATQQEAFAKQAGDSFFSFKSKSGYCTEDFNGERVCSTSSDHFKQRTK